MSKQISPILSVIALLVAVAVFVHYSTSQLDSQESLDASSSGSSDANSQNETYQPRLEHDAAVPAPPKTAVRDFDTFLERLRKTSEESAESLVLHKDGLKQAEHVFRGTVGVPKNVRIEMHSPFFTVDPEAVFALYYDLPTLERGFGLFQQHCSQCHGTWVHTQTS